MSTSSGRRIVVESKEMGEWERTVRIREDMGTLPHSPVANPVAQGSRRREVGKPFNHPIARLGEWGLLPVLAAPLLPTGHKRLLG
jgi:hypothetical protein